jgi:anti-anti-sigma factor
VTDLREVRILNLPVPLHHRTAEHIDALQREFELIQRASPGERSAPHRLIELIGQLRSEFGEFGAASRQQLGEAAERGVESIDLTYLLPTEAGDAARRLDDLLDEADEYCRAGEHLLTLVTPAEALAYRRWFLDEFSRQVDGGEPVPWTDARTSARDEPPPGPIPAGTPTVTGAGTPTVKLSDALDAVSAPALRSILNDVCATRPSRVTVDLSEAPFIDSVGVSVLLSAYGRLRDQGASMEVIASPVVTRTLSIMELQDVLGLRSD